MSSIVVQHYLSFPHRNNARHRPQHQHPQCGRPQTAPPQQRPRIRLAAPPQGPQSHPHTRLAAPLTSLQLESFLTDLDTRLTALEKSSNLHLDSAIETAWHTLQTVRSECTSLSTAAHTRALVLISILENRYHHALTASTLPGKLTSAITILDRLLGDFETRAGGKLGRARECVHDAKQSLQESIEAAIIAAKGGALISYEQLPVPWRVNPHILSGYRFTETKMGCVGSAFTISNETCNIWSHGLGFLLILALAFWAYPTSQIWEFHTTADKVINGLFFLAAGKALACSTIWHTFSSISEQTLMERFACVDYSGISLLIAVSIMTTEYTAFYYQPLSRTLYMSVTGIFGIAGVILPWKPVFNRADMRVWRVIFYLTLGATGTFPMAQLFIERGVGWTLFFYAPVVKSIAVYLFGATVYALQVPEKWMPGCFDWVGGSHNIFHVMVVAGIVFHWYAMHDLFHAAWDQVAM